MEQHHFQNIVPDVDMLQQGESHCQNMDAGSLEFLKLETGS